MSNAFTSLVIIAQAQPDFPVEDLAGSGAGMAAAGLSFLIGMGILVLMVASLWKIFTKAGEPGWAAIVPIYNYMVMAKIGGKEMWWGLLLMVPFINIIASVIISLGMANAFGKDALWGLGLIFLPFIFYPLLAFGSAQYQGHRQVPAGAF